MIPLHPLAHDLFPEMTRDEYDALVLDIQTHGLHDAIELFEGMVIDGRHRQRACADAGVTPRYEAWNGTKAELLAYVVSKNAHRRHMTVVQRAFAAARVAAAMEEQGMGRTEATNAAGRTMAVSPSTVHKAMVIVEEHPDLAADAVNRAEMTMAKVQLKVDVRNAQAESARVEAQPVVATEAILPGGFHAIVLDPPWDIQSPNRNHLDYPTMKLPDIAALPVPTLAAPDGCHLYLWVTHMFLPAGLELVKGWGFDYKHLHTWRKDGGVTPATYQLSTEHVIFATRGSLGVMRKGVRVDFEAPRREHSRKPDVFYEMVRDVSPARRLEMFAREARPGFTLWGNDTARFADA